VKSQFVCREAENGEVVLLWCSSPRARRDTFCYTLYDNTSSSALAARDLSGSSGNMLPNTQRQMMMAMMKNLLLTHYPYFSRLPRIEKA